MAKQRTPVSKRQRLELLDWLRFSAAAAVVAFHYLFNGIVNGKVGHITLTPVSEIVKYGYLGVDLFFLISGYVIAVSARGKTPRRFAVGRALRLYPAFWVALCASTLVLLAFRPFDVAITPSIFAANFTMLPSLLGAPLIDGVYWTLRYELLFYAMVFAILWLGLDKHLDRIMQVWLLGMVAISFFAPSISTAAPLLGGYFLLFGCGAVLAQIRESGWTTLRALTLTLGFIAVLRFEVTTATTLETSKDTEYSGWVVGIIMAVLFGALLAMAHPRVAALRLPGSQTAGALTYPLYLIHATFGYTLLALFATDSNKWFVYPVVIAVVVVLAWLLHRVVEVRLKTFWLGLFDRTLGRLVEVLTPRRTKGRSVQSVPIEKDPVKG